MSNEEWKEVDLTSYGTVKPESNGMVALIDADTIIYAACSVYEFESDDTGDWVIDAPGAYAHSMDRIQSILDATGCTDWELHFTGGRKSFRYIDVDSEYKANRLDTRSVTGLYEMKQYFVEHHADKAFIHYDYEADDIVVALKRDNPDKYVLTAVDKDVIYSLEGKHFNYYSSLRFDIPMKWVDVSGDVAMKHHYHQCLTGDKGDNVIGLAGVGPKTADKMLLNCSSPAECWAVVLEAYISKRRPVGDALKNMRLVNMHQLHLVDGKYEVTLWQSSQKTMQAK